MPLVSPDEIAAIRSGLKTEGSFLTASIEVSFEPFDFARTGATMVDRAVAFANPDGHQLVGLGTAWHATGSGSTRFSAVSSEIAALPNELRVFIGYAFHDEVAASSMWADFTALDAFVPRISISRTDGPAILTVAVPNGERPEPTIELLASMRRPSAIPVLDPGDHSIESIPDVASWAEAVEGAVKVIGAGELDKVVLARSVRVTSTESVQILRVFRELARSYPGCYTFAWKSHDSVFMGASPELLVGVDAGQFTSNPLAGSAPRGAGSAEDEAFGDALVASAKDQEEHRFVVDDIVDRLDGLVENLSTPSGPNLKKMATVQHLSTRIVGDAGDASPFDLVEALHPTPAVGGVPRIPAVSYIDDAEAFDRGWYTGGVGWVTAGGDAEIAIALRCGLVTDATTHLFAGAGIVADSVPADEVDETRLKLRPLLDIVAAT
ncbi:MAG: isochorismate synthase [Acidimicrobiia bacterium]